MKIPVHFWFTGCVVCVFTVALLAPPIWAQQDGGESAGWPLHSSAPPHGLPDAVGMQPATPLVDERDEACLLWTVIEVKNPIVKATTLQIPGKARSEYKKGCSHLKNKKFSDAEKHLRNAIEQHPQYSAAWVLLGEVLESQSHTEEARAACAKALDVDSEYGPAYLCLSDISGQQQLWKSMLAFADRALALDPVQGLYGYFYSAMAQFHLNQLPAAQRNTEQTIDADHIHRLPQAHLLLAQIYGAKHDFQHAADQLRAYLTLAPNAPDAVGVRKSLEDLEGRLAKTSEQ